MFSMIETFVARGQCHVCLITLGNIARRKFAAPFLGILHATGELGLGLWYPTSNGDFDADFYKTVSRGGTCQVVHLYRSLLLVARGLRAGVTPTRRLLAISWMVMEKGGARCSPEILKHPMYAPWIEKSMNDVSIETRGSAAHALRMEQIIKILETQSFSIDILELASELKRPEETDLAIRISSGMGQMGLKYPAD